MIIVQLQELTLFLFFTLFPSAAACLHHLDK